MTVCYTSMYDGGKFSTAAAAYVKAYFRSVEDMSRDEGLFVAFDLKQDFSAEWPKFGNASASGAGLQDDPRQPLRPIPDPARRPPDKVFATDIILVADGGSGNIDVSLVLPTEEVDFAKARIGNVDCLTINDDERKIADWTLKRTMPQQELAGAWLILRIILK